MACRGVGGWGLPALYKGSGPAVNSQLSFDIQELVHCQEQPFGQREDRSLLALSLQQKFPHLSKPPF